MNDNIFKALAHGQRRAILLEILNENSENAEVGSVTGNSPSSATEQQMELVMEHSHLPKLEAYGYIEWNKDTNEVSKGPRFEKIRPLLEWIDDQKNAAD